MIYRTICLNYKHVISAVNLYLILICKVNSLLRTTRPVGVLTSRSHLVGLTNNRGNSVVESQVLDNSFSSPLVIVRWRYMLDLLFNRN